MKFDEAKTKKRKTHFISTPELEIHTTVDELNRITQFTCTKDGKTKLFKVSGKDDAAITRAFQAMEKFIGQIKTKKKDGRVSKKS